VARIKERHVAEFPPTAEQQAAVDAFTAGGTLAITAGAGTGKTSTLRMVAESRPDHRGLYVAFNKAVQLEADASFPANVTSKTAHALAYRTHGAPLRARMQGPRMSSASVAQVLALRSPVMLDGADGRAVVQPAQQAALVVARYCRSADQRIAGQHFVPPEGTEGVDLSELRRVVVAAADRAWADLSSLNGRLKPTHDHYLKQWALTDPKLAFDFILYDEAQDADPCIAGVLLCQDAQLVAVGDRAQALYQWRGNADILSTLAADHRVSLTQSWRFGPAVAAEANLWLAVLGDYLRITGSPGRDSRVAPVDTPDAVLCRSNAGAVRTVMEAHDAGRKPALVGGGVEILRLAEAARRLQAGQSSGPPELVAFDTWGGVVDYARNDPAGTDLAIAVKLIERFGADEVIAAIGSAIPEARADIVVSTVHKAKGREWDEVRIGTDFNAPTECDGEAATVSPAEAMLGYVAVTRARTVLDTGGLAWVHDYAADRGIEAEPRPVPESVVDVPSAPPRTVSVNPPVPTEAAAVLAQVGLSLGMEARVDGETGVWRLVGFASDGSVSAVGGPYGHSRNFMPEWCYRAGPSEAGGGLPAERRGLRAAWRAEYGLTVTSPRGAEPPAL
jgi:hypothetical protein